MPSAQPSLLRIAVIGGGPGGLGAAITLSKLDNVEVSVYEQASVLKEVGAGINIGSDAWRVLELLGVADGIDGHVISESNHRNGFTGNLLNKYEKYRIGLTGEFLRIANSGKYLVKYSTHRVRRTRLQLALKAKVPEGTIKLKKKLSRLENLGSEGVRLYFEDGTQSVADMVVGADGVRSAVRQHAFPDYSITFSGTTCFRALIPLKLVSHIPDITPETTWWHGPNGHVYGSMVDDPDMPVENQMFEIAARTMVDPTTSTGKKFSWGIPATNARVESLFADYDPRVREALSKVPEGSWKEYAAFSGPKTEKLVGWDGKLVLIGDASHPLPAAFGSGAAFALEDAFILARAIDHTRLEPHNIAAASATFDQIRSPYYSRMYDYLEAQNQKLIKAKTDLPKQSLDDSLRMRIGAFGGEESYLNWIHGNDLLGVWERHVQGERFSIRQR